MVRDAKNWEVEPERSASKFDAEYYRKLLEKAWAEVAFVFDVKIIMESLGLQKNCERYQKKDMKRSVRCQSIK